MFDDKVVVLHALDVLCNTSVDMVWFLVVLQAFVVCEHRGYVGRAE